jgi:hypothetical protein
MGAFPIISSGVGVFHQVVSSLTISFSITWKLSLLLLCLLSTTTTSTTGTKKHYNIMARTPCNQVMQHGTDLIGIRFFLLLHHDPDFVLFTKILKDKYDHAIADQTEVDALLFFDGTKEKLVSIALKDLKSASAQSVVEQSIHLNTTAVANNGLSLFKALPFKWMDKSGPLRLLQSSNDLTAHSWFDFCLSLEYYVFNNRLWVHPYYCHQRICSSDNGYGFLVADPIVDCDSDLPLKYDYLIEDWNDQLYQALSKTGVLPDGLALKMVISFSGQCIIF